MECKNNFYPSKHRKNKEDSVIYAVLNKLLLFMREFERDDSRLFDVIDEYKNELFSNSNIGTKISPENISNVLQQLMEYREKLLLIINDNNNNDNNDNNNDNSNNSNVVSKNIKTYKSESNSLKKKYFDLLNEHRKKTYDELMNSDFLMVDTVALKRQLIQDIQKQNDLFERNNEEEIVEYVNRAVSKKSVKVSCKKMKMDNDTAIYLLNKRDSESLMRVRVALECKQLSMTIGVVSAIRDLNWFNEEECAIKGKVATFIQL